MTPRVVYFRTEAAPAPSAIIEHPFVLAGRWPNEKVWPDVAIRVETRDGKLCLADD